MIKYESKRTRGLEVSIPAQGTNSTTETSTAQVASKNPAQSTLKGFQ